MDVLDIMDALQVHALAAANTAGGSTFYDVAVGFPVGKGRCVRIFYGGERGPEHFEPDRTLDSSLIAQAITTRAYWPLPGTQAARQRAIEGEMAVFVKSYRTRVLGDSQLGGESADLLMALAVADQVVISGTQYAVVDIETIVDFDEYPIAK